LIIGRKSIQRFRQFILILSRERVAWRALCCLCVLVLGHINAIDAAESYHWKAITEGQVKIDDKTPITWNMYQPDKKKDAHLVLVLLGHRWLMVDIKAKTVYQVTPGDLRAQDKDYESGDLANPSALIPTSEWIEHDVGPAEDIHITLGDYGRVLELELPHLIDLRAFY
jgi:hypothetical protein